MSNNSKGWSLTARLIGKHFGALGEKIAIAIASFDPETATEADRDTLAKTLREVAEKLASARSSFEKERLDVVKLRQLIEDDEKAFVILANRLQAGTISEETVNLFCDEVEANKARLPVEENEEAEARQYMDELNKIVAALSEQLTDFDAHAKKAMRSLEAANAQRDLQQIRIERQEHLNRLGGLKTKSTALDALTRRAQKVSDQAESLKIVSEINQRPIDRKAALDELRKSVASSESASETTLERLNRLATSAA
ncbi:MAG: hypothetical protein EOO52_12950 [Gammaproteobacteria bacterium]|nr:MAG: hypothetical protein EOO52_12950 [Gammaproteobacteria bacterium]